MPNPGEVRAMFGRIARHYDLLNRALSLGIDQRWRRAAVRAAERVLAGAVERALVDAATAQSRDRVVVDVCCGTGDLALAFEAAGACVLGVDFTPQMVARAERKRMERAARGRRALVARAACFAQGDALRLPVRDAVADVTSIAFGLRNVADRGGGLRELARVTRAGGCVIVLEFSMPPGALLGPLYRAYFTRLLPLVGRVVSRHDDAYAYLPRTVLQWPAPDALEREMRDAGLEGCGHELLTGGIACLHWGRVPSRTSSSVRSSAMRSEPSPTPSSKLSSKPPNGAAGRAAERA